MRQTVEDPLACYRRWPVSRFLLAFALPLILQGLAAGAAVPAPVLAQPPAYKRGSAVAPTPEPPAPAVGVPNGSVTKGTISGQFISSAEAAYQICSQDVIEIRVFGQSSMDTVTRVDTRGFLNFPPVGQIRVADLTERQLETLLEDRLRLGFLQDPHVSAFVREMHPREVAIIGEIKSPGRYPYLFGCRSIVELLAKSGGMTDKAGGTAYIMRFDDPKWINSTGLPSSASLTPGQPSVRRITVDLNDLLINGKIGMNIPLMPGDIVTIPDAGFVHLTGKGLEKPGVYPLRRNPNTLEQFIDGAGGLKFEASKKMTLIHGATGGQSGVIERINYNKLLDSKIPGVILRPDDKVVVERSMPKYVLASLGRGLAKIFSINTYYSIGE